MKFRCETCDLSFQSAYLMREHFKSLAHREKADFLIMDVALNKFADILKEEGSKDDKPEKI